MYCDRLWQGCGEGLTNEVRRHEDLGQLLIVLVVNTPQRVLFKVCVLPEPRQGNLARVLVRVLALPVVQNEGGAAKRLEWVLWLGGWRRLILLFSSGSLWLWLSLGLGGSCLLLGRGGLWWWLVLDGLLNEGGSLGDGSEDWLRGDSLVPAGGVGVLGAPLLVEESLEAADEEGGSEEVGEGEALADKVGVDQEVLLDDVDGLEGGRCRVLDALPVVRLQALDGAEPTTNLGEDFLVGKGQPLQDGGIVLLGLAEEGGLLVLGGDC